MAIDLSEERILQAIDTGWHRFAAILEFCGGSGGSASDDGRALDRALQKLRKAYKVRFEAGTGWVRER